MAPSGDATKVAPDVYTTVFENDRVRDGGTDEAGEPPGVAPGLVLERRNPEVGLEKEQADERRRGQQQELGPANAPASSPPYFGVAGGAAGAPGAVGAAGAAGAGPVAGTTDLTCDDIFARLNEVIMNRIATAVVILPRIVGVPMEPKTAWLPPPPNAEPMSAP